MENSTIRHRTRHVHFAIKGRQYAAFWRLSNTDGYDRLILLAMVSLANEYGVVEASQSEIATEARVEPQTVYQCLPRLVEEGEVVVIRRGGGRTVGLYRITWLA